MKTQTEEKFRQELLCQFPEPSPMYKQAFRLWCEFYYSVEEYDRWICSGSYFNGFEQTAMPMTPREYRLINESARKKREEMLVKRRQLEIDSETFERARKDAGQYKHEKIKEILRHLNDRSENHS